MQKGTKQNIFNVKGFNKNLQFVTRCCECKKSFTIEDSISHFAKHGPDIAKNYSNHLENIFSEFVFFQGTQHLDSKRFSIMCGGGNESLSKFAIGLQNSFQFNKDIMNQAHMKKFFINPTKQ